MYSICTQSAKNNPEILVVAGTSGFVLSTPTLSVIGLLKQFCLDDLAHIILIALVIHI
jgi:hypothetical protein